VDSATSLLLSTVTSVKRYSASIARRAIGCIAINAIYIVSTARTCSSVASATNHYCNKCEEVFCLDCKRYFVWIAKIIATVKNVKRSSALIAKLPSLAARSGLLSWLPNVDALKR
jgi:hypothetical protein